MIFKTSGAEIHPAFKLSEADSRINKRERRNMAKALKRYKGHKKSIFGRWFK